LKLSKTTANQFQFQLTAREKDLLLHVLQLYPRVPPAHQRLSKRAEPDASNQRLLDEALAETRAQNQQELRALLADPRRLKAEGRSWCLTLGSGDCEWLLQVLNDVRVGSWVRLGSPENPLKVLNAETAPDLWAMEMAGSFQMRFLELLHG
jgi:hypothetical protein